MTGKDIIVTFAQNGTALAATAIKSDDLTTKSDIIEKASATNQTWREYISGRKEWSLSTNYLVLASAKIRDVLLIGQTYDVTITSGDVSMTGQAILTDAKQSYNIGALAKGSFAFRGTGPLQ